MGDELETVWEDWSNGTVSPTARLRQRIYFEAPIVREFCVQLEYNENSYLEITDPSWLQVARFDHNVSQDRGHDIREEGLHLDVYGYDGKEFVEREFPRVDLNQAPAWCRAYLEEHCEYYLADFERRVGIPEVVRVYDS